MLDSLCGRNGYEANVLDTIQGMVEADIERLQSYRRTKPKKNTDGLPKMQTVWPSSPDEGTAQLQVETERGAEGCDKQETGQKKQSAPNSQMMLQGSKRKVG